MKLTMSDGGNILLNLLPDAESVLWEPYLELGSLQAGDICCEAGQAPAYIYFPTTAIVSLMYTMESGASGEIAMVGREGMIGVSVLMGGVTTPALAVVQSAGAAYKVRTAVVKDAFARPAVMNILLRYTQALVTQMAQTAVCNRHHSVDQQLCRWLLSNLDRVQGSELVTTQELISSRLGVRREGVTAAASKLQEAGVIRYTRGHITVLDRQALERMTCECYRVVQKEYDRLLIGLPEAGKPKQ